jgi:hypothetical protein
VSESNSSNFGLCLIILSESAFSNVILSMSSSNQFYPTRPSISCLDRTQNPVSTTILKYHDSPSPNKNPKLIRSLRETFISKIVREELFPSNVQFRLSAELIAQSSVRPNSSSLCFAYRRNSQEHFYSAK